MLGLFGQQCHAGDAGNLQRTMSLMQVQACALDGVLAEAAGVNVETIRFYQRKGLMQEPDRPQGGMMRTSASARDR